MNDIREAAIIRLKNRPFLRRSDMHGNISSFNH
jgi:hypothetical protein